jgi:hypothetical protein
MPRTRTSMDAFFAPLLLAVALVAVLEGQAEAVPADSAVMQLDSAEKGSAFLALYRHGK